MSYSKEEQKKNRAKWVAALRGGEYEQCRGSLRKDCTFCVMGVALDVFHKETGIGRWHSEIYEKGIQSFQLHADKHSKTFTLPLEVQDFYGLTDDVGTYVDNESESSLTELNDYDGKGLQELADFIESEPEGLFVESPIQS